MTILFLLYDIYSNIYISKSLVSKTLFDSYGYSYDRASIHFNIFKLDFPEWVVSPLWPVIWLPWMTADICGNMDSHLSDYLAEEKEGGGRREDGGGRSQSFWYK